MITSAQVIPLLVQACPSFRTDEDLLYPALGEFANHLLDLHNRRSMDSFQAVGAIIERLHVEGIPSVKEAATIGLLESIQNVWGNNGVDPEAFAAYLLPESRK